MKQDQESMNLLHESKRDSSSKRSDSSHMSKSLADNAIEFAKSKWKHRGSKESKAEKEEKKKEKTKDENYGFSQDFLPVRAIKNGIIITTDSRYIRIMELEASNFEQMDIAHQNNIIAGFYSIFRLFPVRIQFKTVVSHINVDGMIQNIHDKNINTTDPQILDAIDDHIESIRMNSGNIGIQKRYFIVMQYESIMSEEGKTFDFSQIVQDMSIAYSSIAKRFEDACGNIVVTHENENLFLLQCLYEFYNPLSSRRETIQNRMLRVDTDRKKYLDSIGEPVTDTPITDYIAPRGIDFSINSDFLKIDGLYYSFLAVCGNGYPEKVSAGWLTNCFYNGVGVNLDVYLKRLPQDITKYKIQKYSSLTRISANEKATNRMKYMELMDKVNNSESILNQLTQGENLYECVIILTIWDTDSKSLLKRRRSIAADLRAKDIRVETSHLDCMNYFKMTAPLLDLQSRIFSRNEHNFLTSTAASLYNMTSSQVFDPTGFAMGYNLTNGSVVAINNFNTAVFNSGNMMITGTTGAGKSFTEMYIARSEFFTGVGTFYILPVKGHEYAMPVQSLGGEYIRLMPGSPDCINIMEIRPAKAYTHDGGSPLDMDEEKESTRSLLAKKIASLGVWIQLLLTEGDGKITVNELNNFNTACMDIYANFGITDDNNSIYEADGSLKYMPTIQELYEVLRNDVTLERLSYALKPFVSGSFKNMNQQTNVDLNNRCIAFDVDENVIGKDYLAAMMYIALDCAYDLVKEDTENFDLIILDEVWKMLKNKTSAEQVQQLIKLIRGYRGAALIATQEISDFLNAPGGFGSSVITNTTIHYIMHLEREEAETIGRLKNLTPLDINMITQFQRGCGLLVANRKKVPVQVKASDLEAAIFDTNSGVQEKNETIKRLLKMRAAHKAAGNNTFI